jgi:hypothetical protein
LYGLILSVLIFAVPVYAVDYSGTLTAPIPTTQTILAGLGGGATFINDGTPQIITWRTNFDTVGIPDSYIIYSSNDVLLSGSSTFFIQDDLGTYATGTIQFLNGTSMYGTNKQYMYLHFSTWTPGTRSGQIEGNLTIPIGGAVNTFGSMGLDGGVAIPLGPDNGAGGFSGGNGGTIYTPLAYNVIYNYNVSTVSGSGGGLVSEVIITRPGNNLASNMQLFDAATNTPDYISPLTDSTSGESVLTIGDNYYLSAYVPLNLQYYNTSIFYPPTVPPAGGYSIQISPSSISPTGTATGTIVSSIGGNMGQITDISWSWSDSTGSYDFVEAGNSSRLMDYTNISNVWYGFETPPGGLGGSYTNYKGTIPNPRTLSNISSGGLKTITCDIGTTSGLWYTLTGNLTITSTGMQTLKIDAKDFDTGGLISYTNFKVLNTATNLWTNVTASGGTFNFLYPYNAHLYIESSATDYVTTYKNWTVTSTPTYNLWMIMYRGETPAAGNVTLQVEVFDATNLAPIPGALVHAYQTGQTGESKLTSGSGVTTFNTSQTSIYTIAVTKYGYQNGGSVINTGPGGAIIDEVIMLHRATAPTPTVTIPTTVPSGVPTMVGGNYTGFWGPMYNLFSSMGADSLTMQLLMACFFVFCGVVVGGFGMGTIIPGVPFSGTGAEAGGVFAFVLACALGFISILWLIVIFVWIAFRYFLR